MLAQSTQVHGAMLFEPDLVKDARGYFANTWSQKSFVAAGIDIHFDYACVSHNARAGTLRGIHFQLGHEAEAKLVSCVRGAIFDVAVDLRPGSPTYLKIAVAILTEENRRSLFIPVGCAHGFQTLEDMSDVHYFISGRYTPSAAQTVAWNDPQLAIPWPEVKERIMSESDRSAAPYSA